MKRFAFAVGLILLVFAVSIWAQTTAPKPDPEIKKFDVFLGHWTYTGEYKAGPLGPANKVTGEMATERILGGFFVQNQYTEKGPMGESHALEIIGYDPANKIYPSTAYGDDGASVLGAYVLDGNIFNYSGKLIFGGKQYQYRVTEVFAADLMSFMQKAEISADGNTWTPFFEANIQRVPKPAPKK
jgi:hypothetical protein